MTAECVHVSQYRYPSCPRLAMALPSNLFVTYVHYRDTNARCFRCFWQWLQVKVYSYWPSMIICLVEATQTLLHAELRQSLLSFLELKFLQLGLQALQRLLPLAKLSPHVDFAILIAIADLLLNLLCPCLVHIN